MSLAKSYDSWANSYDDQSNKTRDLDKLATQQTLAAQQFETIIELGCGTGKNTAWLVDICEQLIALDFSAAMLAKAKAKIQSPKVTFRQADLNLDWQLQSEIADLATCNLVLEHIEDLDSIFRQAYSVLKKGGQFFICELHPFKQYAGSKARFETEEGVKELEVYIHDVSEYLSQAKKNGFHLLKLEEWFDQPRDGSIPRLISFLFEK